MTQPSDWRAWLRHRVRRLAVRVERWFEAAKLRIRSRRPPQHLRIEPYLGHGYGARVVVRGRVLDDPEPAAARRGERVRDAARRTLARFASDELPGVPLRVHVGGATVETASDDEGYFDLRLDTSLAGTDGPWVAGSVELAAPYRGVTDAHTTPLRVRVPGPRAGFGVISDIDDTILETGAQRLWTMVRRTVTGSALTRTSFPGAPELYRALAGGRTGGGDNPVFYVSSSPWNLHAFLVGFIEHRGFPLGPLLLRDLLGGGEERSHASHKHERVAEVLELHPDLRFVLIGDSGEADPDIYAEVVERFPGRILAVYLREVRLDPGDGRVEAISDGWAQDVPYVLAADSAAIAEHAAGLGLIPPEAVAEVVTAVRAQVS